MTNPERREKIEKILDILIQDYLSDDFFFKNKRIERTLSALESLMPQVMSEEEIYKIVYAVERKTCASEECEITCPAYKENEEYSCGARQRSRELAKALTIARPVMTIEEVEKVIRESDLYDMAVNNGCCDEDDVKDLASKLIGRE